jgi:predicted aconitase with swiveling domain
MKAQTIVPGEARAEVVVLDQPLSFWGGFDAESGLIIDEHHPQTGTLLTNKIVVMPAGRGSSSASSVIAEAARLNTAPAALVMLEVDEIVTIGSIVADELYDRPLPVFVVGAEDYTLLAAAHHAVIAEDGTITPG